MIPQTLAEDGDPLDVLVLSQEAVAPLTLVATTLPISEASLQSYSAQRRRGFHAPD